MAERGKKKAAIGVGVLALIGAAIYGLTRKAKAEPPPPPPGLATLYGKVTDAQTGQPIPGVRVTLDGLQVSTDGQGNYILADVEPGGYIVTFEKAGYEPKTF